MEVKILKELVNRQTSVWTLVKEKSLSKKKKVEKYHSGITVSRETGSGGRLIAQKVAQKLNFKYYDKRIVDLIVKRANKRQEFIKSLDEKSLSFIEETINSLFGGGQISGPAYFRHLVKVVLALARKRACVILGRGSNFILPSQTTLKVRIIAPLQTRIENSMKYEGNSREEAKAVIKKIHFERKDFVKRYFGKDISNANYYDLVINTKDIGLDQAVAVIASAFKQKFPELE